MDTSYIDLARQLFDDYWPHASGAAIAVASAVFAHLRRPRSTARDTGPYFTAAELLTPPLVRPAYSDRMAYVLAEMSDLAYYQFEGQGGFIEDAVQLALERNLTEGQDIRQFLDQFSTDLMSGRRLSLDAFRNVLANSGFSLVDVIDIRETQGFVCRRNVADEPPYLVLAFRGTEKKVSDWLTDARCVPTVEGKTKCHTGFLEAFTKNVDAEGRTVKEVVREILDRPEAKGWAGSTASPVHHRTFARRRPRPAGDQADRTRRHRRLLHLRSTQNRQLRVLPLHQDPRLSGRQLRRRRTASPSRRGDAATDACRQGRFVAERTRSPDCFPVR